MDVFASLAGFLGISYPAALLLADAGRRPEQALVIHLQYGACDPNRVFELEDWIRQALAKAGGGEYVGHEVVPDRSGVFLHLYGRDADHIFRVIEPILGNFPFLRVVEVNKRVGPPVGADVEAMPRTGRK
ncbi:hypothetical protein [Pseudoduganella violaceinigra]|uniref:hypothetical protein n=1 Tax=Pseudoduganella violaceinigra TaxID=246602 RepID=UPI00041BBDC7|nr:hypothetical protein [Pseudoduganella violaceinigra]